MVPAVVRHLLRATPSAARLENRGVLSVTGSQAAPFLNGLLATRIQPQVNQYSAVLHAQGRVMYDVFLHKTDDGFLLEYDLTESEATPLLAYLKRHVLRSKVKIRQLTDEVDIWATWGSEADKSWESPRQWNWGRGGAVEPVWSGDECHWGTQQAVFLDRRAVGLGRRLISRKSDSPPETSSYDVVPSEAYLLHRILHGVPEGSQEIIPMHAFPMESNLDAMGGLDFRKGCYVGQELTVRTYHTGVIRKRILPVYFRSGESLTNLSVASPSGMEVKPVVISDSAKPRPRGNGKLLATHGEVGLALLRLDHVAGVQTSEVKLTVEDEAKGSIEVIPWWPSWWPHPELNSIDSEA